MKQIDKLLINLSGILFIFLSFLLLSPAFSKAEAAAITWRATATATGNGATSITINKPTGTVQNDILIAGIEGDGNNAGILGISAPAGWTQVQKVDNQTGSYYPSVAVFYKVAGASEGTSYQFTYSNYTTTAYSVGFISAYYNADTSTPIEISNGKTVGTSTSKTTSFATNSVTTSTPGDMIVAVYGSQANGTWDCSVWCGTNERADVNIGASLESIESGDVLQSAAGATGTESSTQTATGYGGAIILAIKAVNTAPSITVNPTASYGSYTRTSANNTPYTVSFTATDAEQSGTNGLTYYLHTGAGRTGTQVATGTFTSGAATPTVAYNATGMANGSNTLYLSVYDGALYSSGNPSFTVLRDDIAPTASTSISTNPTTVTTSTQYTVTFTPNDAASTSTNEMAYEIRTASAGGGTLLTSGGTATSGTAVTTATITDSTLANGSNTRYIRTRDGANNWTDTSFTVTADLSAVPTVTTNAASSVTAGEATLNGNANPNYLATSGWLRYSTTDPVTCNDSFGTKVGITSLGSGGSGVGYTASLTNLLYNTAYYYCAIAQNSKGTTIGSKQTFTTLSTNCGAAPINGNTTVSSSCAFSTASGGADAGTGTTNTAIITIGAGKTLTIGNVNNQKVAFGQIVIQSGGAIIINKGHGASLVKSPVWVNIVDADGDGYPGSIGSTYAIQSTQPASYIRKGTSGSQAIDCNDANANVYQNVTTGTDSDQDGYISQSASSSNCVGASTSVSGRTYYKDTSGTYTWLADASKLGVSDCNDANATIYRNAYTDADGDGYAPNTTLTCIGSSLTGYVISPSGTSDCNDANANVYQNVTSLGADADQDGYYTGALSTQCVGGTSTVSGRTYYKWTDGTYSRIVGSPTGGVNAISSTADCYDSNANAHPGQTSYFTTDRGDGSYDYDCSGSVTSNTSATNYCSTALGSTYPWYTTGSCSTLVGNFPECSTSAGVSFPSACGKPAVAFAYHWNAGCYGTTNYSTGETIACH